MRKRRSFVGPVVVGPLAGLLMLAACVDLFHGTDFETLCTKSPDDPRCKSATDGPIEASEGSPGADVVEKPIPDFCAWGSDVARKNAERACAWLSACVRPHGSSAFAECLVHAQLAYDCVANPNLRPRGDVEKAWGCLANVTSCADLDACMFPEGKPTCQAGSSEGTACGVGASASVRIGCSPTRGTEFDFCPLTGRTCVNSATGAECVPTTTPCSGTRTCAEGIARDCVDGDPDRGVDCRAYGAKQCAQAVSEPGCRGNDGGTCSGSEIKCEGAQVKACVANEEIVIDCSRFGASPGLPCADEADAGAINPPPTLYAPWRRCFGSICSDAEPKCVSDDVEVCVRGVPRTVECKKIGLGACSAATKLCAPPQ